MKIEILNKAKKKKIIQNLEEFGIKKIPELLVRTGRERIRAYSGSLSTEEIYDLWRILPIEGVGLYVAKDAINKKIGKQETRISLDGLHTWKDQITQKIITLTEEQEEEWFKGKNIELTDEQQKENFEGFVIIKSSDKKDFIGTGKIGDIGKTIYAFLPKERRRKSQTI
ncbi:hypothetical protein HN604_01870 [archaeon]|jgi:NOL1/NOP2/fmu family ribosome biogenesis protein|nr:hypothetical protein [archaeon]MBT6182950.1 hypothetical protein [archaeon]MBT6606585.1 hypothetical protein [archaeon]MBT7251788.1 hypothetical protein [archaeon]MBT7660809.1 hypothetical protein [archaeon]